MKTKNLIAKLILIVMVVLTVLAIYSNRKVKAYNYTDSDGLIWTFDTVSGLNYGYGSITVAANVRVRLPDNRTKSVYELVVPEELNGYKVVSIASWPGNYGMVTRYSSGGFNNTSGSSYDHPDFNYYDIEITDIVLPDSLVEIGDYALNGSRVNNISTTYNSYSGSGRNRIYYYSFSGNTYGLYNLRNVNIPRRVKRIGNYAFNYCLDLRDANFDSKGSLTSIGDYAFNKCIGITEVNIPRNVTTIGNYAFNGCSYITSVTFAENSRITTIGDYAFYDLQKLNKVDFGDNCNLTTIGNYAFAQRYTSLVGTQEFDFTKLKNLTTIGNYAFNYSLIDGLDLSQNNKLTTIGAYAFYQLGNEQGNIVIPESVTTIGDYAFSRSKISGVEFAESDTKVAIGSYAFASTNILNLRITNRIQSIGTYAFNNCSDLGLVIFDNDTIIDNIPNNCFYNSGVTRVVFSPSIKTIGNYAFSGTKLENVTIPGNVTTIGTSAFSYTPQLNSVVIEESNAENVLTKIPFSCFSNSGLNSISIPSNVTTIDQSAFNTTKFTEFEIPASITTINDSAFANCADLEIVTFENGSTLTTIPSNCFLNAGLTSIDIPDSVTTIGRYAFSGTKFTEFEIPANIETIENYAFKDTKELESVTFENGSKLKIIKSYSFQGSNIRSIELGESVEEIQSYAFDSSNIESITIKANVNTLGTNIFSNCKNLKRVVFEESSAITKIPDSMFRNTTLEEIVLPEGLTEIGNYAFECTKLQSFTVPSTVVKIGTGAFRGTEELTEFNFAEESELTTIPAEMFAGSGIEEIEIPSYITTIGNKAFGDYSFTRYIYNEETDTTTSTTEVKGSNIRSITIPNNVTSIGSYLFSYTNNLEEVIFEDGSTITTIPSYCFYHSNITEFEIPENITRIDGYAFDSSNIEEIVIPNTVNTLGIYAYQNTLNAKSLVFEENPTLTIIPNYCFYNSGIESIEFVEGITTLQSYCFVNCHNLKGSIILPDSITVLGSSSISTSSEYPIFAGCESLDGDLVIGEGVTRIPAGFMDTNCTNMKRIILGSNVTDVYTDYTTYGSYQYNGSSYYGNHTAVNGAFPHLTIIYTKGNPNNVNFRRYWNNLKNEPQDTKIEYIVRQYQEFVTVSASTLPGVKIINNDTNEEIETISVRTGTSLNYRIEIADEYQERYPYLKIYRSTMDGYGSKETIDYTAEVQSMSVIEEGIIGVINTNPVPDLALRMFISKINQDSVLANASRVPAQGMINGDFSYLHTKQPYLVAEGDYVRYTIRVFNEGSEDANANKVNIFIPEGLEFIEENKINSDYKWVSEGDGKYSSTYLANTVETIENEDGTTTTRIVEDKSIDNFYAENGIKYRDIDIVLKVVASEGEQEKVFNVISEIAEMNGNGVTVDLDSTPGSITEGVDGNYRHEEAMNSSSSTYVAGIQDDDDFESVKLNALIRSDYEIVIGKIDGLTNELLKGAKFNLLDSEFNVIDEGYTNDEGLIDFGMHTTYGTQDDVYYIEEAQTPDAYIAEQKAKVKLMVHKKPNGHGSDISMDYELAEYEISTDKATYIPITNEEELSKIGSGEVVVVNGKEYTFSDTANYELLNDIDLSTDSNWNPIVYLNGIFEGNGHKISNLLYATSDAYADIGQIGLFKTFDGIIDNVILDNVQIHVNVIDTRVTEGTEMHTGIGAFAGQMISGTIQNCTVNGSITASTDNVGGFVGHTTEGHIVRFINNTNNATVYASNCNSTEEERDATSEELEEVSELEPTKTIYKINNVSGTTIKTDVDYLTGKAQTTYTATASNIGGIVGCSLGSMEMKNCVNNAEIHTPKYNGAGLVGYLDATDYKDIMNIYPSLENNTIKLVLQNTKVTGNYELRLTSKDVQTLGLITGGVYQVLDKDKNVIPGYENLEITEDSMKIADVDISDFGIDTYYISEVSPAEGYQQMEGKIKVEISKYWDKDGEKFKVKVRCVVLTDEEYENDTAKTSTDTIDSSTGLTYEIDFSHSDGVVGFDQNDNTPLLKKKPLIQDSVNNGKIMGIDDPCNVAGIVANSQSKTIIIGCENNGDIFYGSSAQNANVAGIIAEIDNWALDTNNDYESKIINSVNKGYVSANGATVSCKAAGIITRAFTNITINNCSNEGKVDTAGSCGSAGGILCVANGDIKVNNCSNSGEIKINAKSGINHAAGIIAEIEQAGYFSWANNEETSKYYGLLNNFSADDNSVELVKCENTGIITGDGSSGGIAGSLTGTDLIVKECKAYGTEDEKLSISYYGNSNAAGIIGYSTAKNNTIERCSVDRINVFRNASSTDSPSSAYSAAGIIGTIDDFYRNNASGKVNDVNINNCIATNIDISLMNNGPYNSNTSGIAGYVHNARNIIVNNNIVNNINTINAGDGKNAGVLASAYQFHSSSDGIYQLVANDNIVTNAEFINQHRGSSYENISGIVGYDYYPDTVIAMNNKVDNITAQAGKTQFGGIIGGQTEYTSTYVIMNNEAYNLDVKETGGSGSDANKGGIIVGTYRYISSNGSIIVSNNKVKGFKYSSTGNSGSSLHVAGIAGVLSESGNSLVVENNKAEDLDFYQYGGFTYACGAGIVGFIHVSSSYSTSKSPIILNNNNIRKLKIVNQCGNTNVAIGGIVGVSSYYYYPMELTNTSAEDLDFTCYYGNVGGIIGTSYVWGSDPVKFTLQDVNVKNIKIVHYPSGNGSNSAGVAGSMPRSNYYNVSVENFELTNYGNYGNIGGIVGWRENKGLYENVHVKNFKINNNSGSGSSSYSTIGGIQGSSYTDSGVGIYSHCKVEDSELKGGHGNAQIGGFLGMNWGSIEVYNSEIINSKLYTTENVYTNTSSGTDNGVGGFIGPGQSNGMKFYGNKMKNVEIYTQAMVTCGICAGYSSNTQDIQDFEAENVKIIDNREGSSRSAYTSNFYNICTGMVNSYSGANLTNIKMKNIEIDGCAHNVSLMMAYASNGVTVTDVELEDIKITNHGQPDYYSSASSAHYSQQTALFGTEFSGSKIFTNIKIKNVEMIAGKGDMGILTSYSDSSYGGTYNNLEFENISMWNKGIYVDGSGNESELLDGSNSMGLLAGPTPGGTWTINGSSFKNIRMRNDRGFNAGIGTLFGKTGNANVTLNGTIIDDVKIENYADRVYKNSYDSGEPSIVSAAGGIIAIGGSLTYNGGELSNIDITVGTGETPGGGSVVGGIAGSMCGGGLKLYGTKIHDIAITNNNRDMAGGLIGVGGYTEIQGAEIKNITVEENINPMPNRTNSYVGGLFGEIYNPSKIQNCDIENIEVTNRCGKHTGGIYGVTWNGQLENNTIKNIKVNNETTAMFLSNDYTGGIAGADYSSSETSLKNNIIEDIEVVNYSPCSTGGLYGYASTLGLNGDVVNNISTKHLKNDFETRTSYMYGGGLAGMVTGSVYMNQAEYEDTSVVVDDVTGEETTITETKTRRPSISNIDLQDEFGGCVGGIIGLRCGYSKIEDVNFENINVDIDVDSIYTGDNNFGGLIGASTNRVELDGVNITNNKVNANITSFMGGIVGFAYSDSPVVKNTTMNNIIVNQEVPHNLCARSPRAGGITSILLHQPTDFETGEEIVMYENIDINDILVNIKTYDEEGNEVFSGLSEVGGLVGLTDFAAAVTGFSEYTGDPVELSPAREINLIANNISIKNTGDTFEDGTPKGIHGYGYAGGILGFGKATLNSISLENVDIESYLSAGGAVGHTDSATSIVGFDYKDSTITTFDANRGPNNCHTGGVLGYVGKDSLVKDATIDNVLINNEGYGNVGGIVGLTNKTNAVEVGVTIINAAVKNCTKELEDGTKLGITGKAHVGGFIGFGKINATYGPNGADDYSEVTNCYIAGKKELADYDRYGYYNTDVGGFGGNIVRNAFILGARLTDCYIENNRLREKRFPEEPINYTEKNNNVDIFAGFNEDWLNHSNMPNCTYSGVTVKMNEQ